MRAIEELIKEKEIKVTISKGLRMPREKVIESSFYSFGSAARAALSRRE